MANCEFVDRIIAKKMVRFVGDSNPGLGREKPQKKKTNFSANMGPPELPIEPKDIPRAGADERKPRRSIKRKQFVLK